MKKESIKNELIIKQYAEQIVFDVTINILQAKELALLLILLQESIEDRVEIDFKNFKLIFKNNKSNICEILDLDKKYGQLGIDSDLRGYLLMFLLKYYQQGFGTAEHIDLDFSYKPDIEVTLTIKLEKYIEYSHVDKTTRIIKK